MKTTTTAALPIPRTAPDTWQVVEAAQAGDRDAFANIYRANYNVVFRFVYFRTGHRQTAEDLTADVFVRALIRIGTVEWQGRDIAAWLITIARNLVADHFKSGRYRYELTAGDLRDDDRANTEPDAASEAVAYLTNVALLKAVKSLPSADQQQVLICRFLRGLSVEETAEVMATTEGAVKALQYRATQRLARNFQIRSLAAAA